VRDLRYQTDSFLLFSRREDDNFELEEGDKEEEEGTEGSRDRKEGEKSVKIREILKKEMKNRKE